MKVGTSWRTTFCVISLRDRCCIHRVQVKPLDVVTKLCSVKEMQKYCTSHSWHVSSAATDIPEMFCSSYLERGHFVRRCLYTNSIGYAWNIAGRSRPHTWQRFRPFEWRFLAPCKHLHCSMVQLCLPFVGWLNLGDWQLLMVFKTCIATTNICPVMPFFLITFTVCNVCRLILFCTELL